MRLAVRHCEILRCDTCAVRHQAVCNAVGVDGLRDLNRIAHHRHVPAGRVIGGDEDVIFANIQSGIVKLTKTLRDGRQQNVGLLFPPDFVGRVFSDTTPYWSEAVTDVELCTFPRAGFESLLKRYPDLEHQLFEHTLDQLDAAHDWMLLLGRKTAQEKVASLFLLITLRTPDIDHDDASEENSASFVLPLTRADIADFLGLTLETVSRQITRLRSTGAIRLTKNHGIVVPDIDALKAIAGT